MSERRERPILFSGAMIRAILDGRKTVTRRVVKWPAWVTDHDAAAYYLQRSPGIALYEDGRPRRTFLSPYGQPGDRMWVRETWAPVDHMTDGCVEREDPVCVGYQADHAAVSHEAGNRHPLDVYAWNWERAVRRWRPSIHMPRWACRLLLDVVAVRVERLQAITEADAVAEGAEAAHWQWSDDGMVVAKSCYRAGFAALWDSINGARLGCSWADNPWVWVVSFRRDPSAGPGPGEVTR